ncbi:MAG: histidine kinase [Bacillota bacterium]|nr:histidine kinase [Bacillota bacterium]
MPKLPKLKMETIPVFMIALILLLTLVFINFTHSNFQIEQQLSQEYIQIIESKHSSFSGMLERIISTVNTAFYQKETLDLISGTLTAYEKSQKLTEVRLLLQFNRGFQEEFELFYYGFNGISFLKRIPIFDGSVPFEQTDWYRRAVNSDKRMQWFGMQLIMQPSEVQEGKNAFIGCLKIDTDVIGQGTYSGLAYISIDKYTIDSILKASEGITCIVNQDGTVLYNSDDRISGYPITSILDINIEQDISKSQYNIITVDSSPLNRQEIAVISPWNNYGFSFIHIRQQLSILNNYRSLQILYYASIVVIVLLSIYYYMIFMLTIRIPLLKLYEKTLGNEIGKGYAFDKNPVSTGIKQIDDKLNRMINENIRNTNKISQIERADQLLEIKKLQAEIDPHFLYNVLAHIKFSALLDEPDKIATLVDSLFMILNYKKAQVDHFITVREEITILQKYIDIIKIIYEDHITFEIQIDPDIQECLIPSFILQPIVENCVHHALDTSKAGGFVKVTGNKDAKGISFQVIDNGQGIREDAILHITQSRGNDKMNQHMGILNVDKKIKLCCGHSYGIRIDSWPGQGTKVSITLDYRILQIV